MLRSRRRILRSWRGRRLRYVPLIRTEPISRYYGRDRGRPVDRVYIEDFLALHEADIHDDVLEVQSALYGGRYGGTKVASVTVLDIESTNKDATLSLISASLARSEQPNSTASS
jgi:hypothetical protein